MAPRIQLRRDTAANWTTANPVLASGEPGFETDTLLLKIGNGVLTWTALTYLVGSGGGGNVAGGDLTGNYPNPTVALGVIGNTKLSNMANGRIKARITAGTGAPEDATGTQITALLDTVTSGAKGLAPASGGGTTNFLRADGTWSAPPGGGGGAVAYDDCPAGTVFVVNATGSTWPARPTALTTLIVRWRGTSAAPFPPGALAGDEYVLVGA